MLNTFVLRFTKSTILPSAKRKEFFIFVIGQVFGMLQAYPCTGSPTDQTAVWSDDGVGELLWIPSVVNLG